MQEVSFLSQFMWIMNSDGTHVCRAAETRLMIGGVSLTLKMLKPLYNCENQSINHSCGQAFLIQQIFQ